MDKHEITRKQVFFLCILIQEGFIIPFRYCNVLINGLTKTNGYQYLVVLKKIGFLKKEGIYWSITPKGLKYYEDLTKLFDKLNSEPFKWKI